MLKSYLLTPGPTAIPERVLAAMSLPIIHHRTPAFIEIFKEVQAGLKEVFQTKQDVLLLTASGSGGMEAAVTNLFRRGDKVITINAGKFGERWTKLARAYGLEPRELKLEAGVAVEPAQLEAAIRAAPDARAVLFQASETSTGVRHPTEAIARLARAAGMLVVCDAITACGVFEVPMDAWGIDVLITGSQKAFMLPPGLAMIALSDKAWAAVERSDLPKFYFDLTKERKGIANHQTAWTPAISIIVGMRESLRMILREEGLWAAYERHERLARATRAGARALGLELLARKEAWCSPAVTAIRMPPTRRVSQAAGEAAVAMPVIDGTQILKIMREKYGVTVIGGQDELAGKIVRLSHFGYCDRFDIVTAISALESALGELGHPIELGRGAAAVLRELST